MNHCATCGSPLPDIHGLCPACVARSMTSFLTSTEKQGAAAAAPEVPGYELRELIGQGGMGEVFRAQRRCDGVEVAVKCLPARLAEDEQIRERFQREARALASVKHPHILRVFDSGLTADGRLYLATELAEGGDLGGKLRRGRLETADALRIFFETAAAIQETHRLGILHRDIKPANIFLTKFGSVRVGDFSLAKLGGNAGGMPALTQAGDAFGTPYYIAPEVRLGAAADVRADIFALGVLLHELLTGRLPIGNYQPASAVAGLPPAVDRVISRCLSESPGSRPPDVTALLDALKAALRPRPAWKMAAALGLSGIAAAAAVYFPWRNDRTDPLPKPAGSTSPAAASKEQPWTNSLGMRFVPVPGTTVLFSVWETRRRDFAPFATMVQDEAERAWARTGLADSPDHPVTPVNWLQANRFCDWLTRKEHSEETLPLSLIYRLPSDEEWSRAAELPAEPGTTPEERHQSLGPMAHAPYAWGRTWPPPASDFPANFSGMEAENATFIRSGPPLRHRDAWPATAPAGSFPANALGLCDLSGNVSEWCLTPWNQAPSERVLRGGSFQDAAPAALRLDSRGHAPATKLVPGCGFRVVVAPGSGS